MFEDLFEYPIRQLSRSADQSIFCYLKNQKSPAV
jgi:hypothetical protein